MSSSRSRARRAPLRPAPRRRATVAMLALLLLIVFAITGFVLAVPTERFTIDIGPIALPAGADHHASARPAPRAVLVPVDGWLRGLSVEVLDEHGQPIPRELLHHVNLMAPQKRELFSPIMLRLGAMGAETRPVRLPTVLGYRLHRGDSVLVTAMLHNPTTTDHRRTLVRVHIVYTPLRWWFRPLDVHPFYLDVMPPAGKHAYDLPAGHSEQSWEGRPAVPGRIVGVGGHLHKYGVVLRFEDVTAGQVLWEVTPETDTNGKVRGLPTKYFLPVGIPVTPDHVYRLTAVYDNPTGRMIPDGGMGALGGALIPDRGVVWPAVTPDHPMYQHDLDVTYGRDRRRDHGHGSHGAATPAHRH